MDLIFKAINFAARAHAGQTRKKTAPDLPYIVHPVGVAILLAQTRADEKTIAAGLLHDVVEDCNVSKEEIEKEFGADVARMVNDVTEQDKKAPWSVRKAETISHIKNMRRDSLLIKAADSTHNLTEMLRAAQCYGTGIFDGLKAPLPKQIEMFKKLYEALEEKWPENPLLPQVKDLVDKLEKIEKGL